MPDTSSAHRSAGQRILARITGYAVTAVVVAGVTGIIRRVPQLHDVASLSMLYLLAVVGSAVAFGSGPALAGAVLSFLAIDWYFVSPHSFFTAKNPAELLALVVFVIVALTTGQLTGLLRAREEEAKRRASETTALAETSWTVASQVDRQRALEQVIRQLTRVAGIEAAAIAVPGEGAEVCVAAASRQLEDARRLVARNEDTIRRLLGGVPATAEPSARASRAIAIGAGELMPLAIEQRVLGVLCVRFAGGKPPAPEERRVLDSLGNHAAVVLERDRLMHTEARARALAEADRLKTALLSMVSHDFRSPLASIKASVTGLLQEGAPWEPGPAGELLQAIDQETDRLNRMLANLLALSRLEADAWRPLCEWTDVSEVVSAALDSFGEEENRRILVRMHEAPSEAWLDSVQVVQVLHNLLENALKYSGESAPVELSVRQEGETLLFEVLDRGCGLPPGDERKVFDRFYRAPGLGESSTPGLGLGLTVCQGLIEAHRGHLTAANREGGGAVFRIELPIAPPEAQSGWGPATVEGGRESANVRGGGQ